RYLRICAAATGGEEHRLPDVRDGCLTCAHGQLSGVVVRERVIVVGPTATSDRVRAVRDDERSQPSVTRWRCINHCARLTTGEVGRVSERERRKRVTVNHRLVN